ncbi:MAG: hypothetical protein ACRDKZ_05690 [Actinomycetota bacterium]
MHPTTTLEVVRERQKDLRRDAQAVRASKASQEGASGVNLRRGMAHTLRRWADQLDDLEQAEAPRLIDLR